MNNIKEFKGKKWAKANSSRLYHGDFACWLKHEKNVDEKQADQIWEDATTTLCYKNDLWSEYSAKPVKPTVRFQQYLDLSRSTL